MSMEKSEILTTVGPGFLSAICTVKNVLIGLPGLALHPEIIIPSSTFNQLLSL